LIATSANSPPPTRPNGIDPEFAEFVQQEQQQKYRERKDFHKNIRLSEDDVKAGFL